MKTTDEIMADLIVRKDEYNMKNKNDIKRYTKYAACFALVLAILGGTALAFIRGGSGEDVKTPDKALLEPIYVNDEPIVFGKETPEYMGIGTLEASFARKYGLGEAYEDADIVAEIVLTGWLDEYGEGFNGTHFSARVVKLYQDRMEFQDKYPEGDIVFEQIGTSENVFDDFPIYAVGERLFVCLRYIDAADYTDICENHRSYFRAVGEQQTELELIEYEGSTLAIRKNVFYNFGDVVSSVSESKMNDVAMKYYNVSCVSIGPVSSDNINSNGMVNENTPAYEFDNKNIVVLTLDDVLSYLYEVENGIR